MPIAFVLITVKAGTDEVVVRRLNALPYVDEVHEIYGAYDVIAKISADFEEKIKDAVATITSLENIKAVEAIHVSRQWQKS